MVLKEENEPEPIICGSEGMTARRNGLLGGSQS